METEENMSSLRVASFSYYLDSAQENLIHRISAQECASPINKGQSKSATSKSPFCANLTRSLDSQDTVTSLRIDSFSSYLNTAGENFTFKVQGPIPDPTSAFAFPQEKPRNLERAKSNTNELRIFGADKYFNMKLDYGKRMNDHEYKTDRQINSPRLHSNLKSGTPSVCSEASSWNSQAALLHNSRHNKQKKAPARRFFGGFVCQGPCLDKKSVHISGASYGTTTPTRTGSNRVDHFALPVSSRGETLAAPKLEEEKAEEPRKSLEVFGSKTKGDDVAVNLERKLSMLTWDAIPEGQNNPTSTIGSSTICDDMASDASSDLFEIDNISGSVYPLATETTNDSMSFCMSPPTQYAPSEASIEWSVVTASAADHSSVISDYEEKNVNFVGHTSTRRPVSSRNLKGTQKGRARGLLGCKSNKAVDVAETAPLGKLQARAK